MFVLDGEIHIRAPKQLMGVLFGSKGHTINALREKLAEMEWGRIEVHIGAGEALTQKYVELFPDVRSPPEEGEALIQLFDLLKRLER